MSKRNKRTKNEKIEHRGINSLIFKYLACVRLWEIIIFKNICIYRLNYLSARRMNYMELLFAVPNHIYAKEY